MFDPRFAHVSSGRGFFDNLSQHFATLDEAHASFLKKVEFAEQVAGRRLTRSELLQGVQHPEQDRAAFLRDNKRRQQELTPPTVRKTVAELQLEHAEQKNFDAKPPHERELILARKKVEAEKAQKLKDDALDALLSTDSAKLLFAEIAKLQDFLRYDPTVSQGTVDELEHQRKLLMTFGDVRTAAANVRTIKQSLFDAAKAQEAELKQHVDRVATRAQRFELDWDSPPESGHTLMDGRTVTLRFDGDVRVIPQMEYDLNPNKEFLIQKHFGVIQNG